MGQIAGVRTNTRYELNYDNKKLSPEVELIILFAQPEYQLQKGKISKGHSVKEFRVNTDVEGLKQLIGELQATMVTMTHMDSLGHAFNSISEQIFNKESNG